MIDLIASTRGQIEDLNTVSLSIFGASDLPSMAVMGEGVLGSAQRAHQQGILQIEAQAKGTGIISLDIIVPDVPEAVKGPSTVTVIIDQFQFINRTVTVQQGTTVVWINNEGVKHTATDDDNLFNSGSMGQGDVYSFTFDQPGEFPYYCRFHGDAGDVGMAGKIIVETGE